MNSAKARTWIALHHKQIARITNSSAYRSHRTNSIPPQARASRVGRSHGVREFHATGEHSATIEMDHASPSSATGIPRNLDSALVVTRAQSIAPEPEHARRLGVVKWAIVR